MTKMKILALLAGMVLLLAIPAAAFAQGEPPPGRYFGSVTVDGEDRRRRRCRHGFGRRRRGRFR